ncbi:acyltransferase domain-containing protein [Actinoalloteichus caeruleus]|uniref:acyltransferase domain-containing protein n=1 Tax=Actinoalloteichus cyanogriseus TaxID=2893586 RepID=UPI00068AF741|nr:acyltransferase domain-containing protein [Actinoalloteichus caeruleus]
MSERSVFLFPGLGAYSPGALRRARRSHPQVDATFQEIDAAAVLAGAPPVSTTLFDGEPRSIRQLLAEPAEVLQLAIFGISVAVHRVLTERGARPHLLVGHSFGEMAALVAAGAFSLADGVTLVCARAAALRPWEGRGAMTAVGMDRESAGHVPGVLDEPELVVACLNAPRQTVLAGPPTALDRVERLAEVLDVPHARLHLPYASHHPTMRPAVADFVARMADARQLPLQAAVHSPVHGRRYTDDDDLKQALAECLVLPVRFTDTVRSLHSRGYTTYVESGALNTLTRCVEHTVPGVRTTAPLLDPEEEDAGLRAALTSVARPRATPIQAEEEPVPSHPAPAGEPEPTDVRPAAAPPGLVPPPVGAAPDREHLVVELRALYAETLEYPPELLTEDALLEAELGVDSLKQTSLLGRVADRFGLPAGAAELPVWELPTLRHVADHVAAAKARR